MDRSHQLAEFLRTRRERVKPEDVGISTVQRRRVPGLRREEVARRAKISADYYMRLEQGRDHQPSAHVLQALARALVLDDDATAHLFALGRPERPIKQPRRAPDESVWPELQDLLDAWTTTPAFIHGRRLDVLAANALARALTPLAKPRTNLLRAWFLDPEDRKRYDDVKFVQSQAVAYFRASVANHLDEPDITDLVDELSHESEEFRQMWARHDVQLPLSGENRYLHPVVGALRLRYQTFAVDGTDRQRLFVVSAAPGSRDAQALAHLAPLAADLDSPPSEHEVTSPSTDRFGDARSGS